jgi:hypothetical protein
LLPLAIDSGMFGAFGFTVTLSAPAPRSAPKARAAGGRRRGFTSQ